MEGDQDEAIVRVLKLKDGRHVHRAQVKLSEDQENAIKVLLKQIWTEWMQNTSLLKSKLLRANNLMEGIKEPKTFPWRDCSNLHVPVPEIHMATLHSVASETMLQMEPVWYVKPIQDGVPEDVDADIESFLHAKSKVEIKVDQVLSDVFWNTYRDGTGLGVLDWVEEYGKRFDSRTYHSVEEFQQEFPSPDDAGLDEQGYRSILAELLTNTEVSFMIQEELVTYRGPKLRIVELKDYIMIPTTAPDTEYAMFVGDAFTERDDYYNRMAKNDGWFKPDAVKKVVAHTGLSSAPDQISQSQDQIEGVGRSRNTPADEKTCMQGLLKYDLDGDGMEEKFLIVYHPDSNSLLRMERFPYWHNRSSYIPWRFKKRPKRFLGQSIPDQLEDISNEIDTQHNQRVDSRTITLVPSFMKLDTSDWDPTRKDQRFFPGVTFKMSNFNQVKQFDIKQTDMGQSMQEETSLMAIADQRTGASQLQSGMQNQQDPRSPAKKAAILLSQSNQRIDDHMRELRYGTEELGYQILELYYQFSPDTISYPKFNPETQSYIQAQVQRAKLRSPNLVLQVARASVMDNPSQTVQRLLTIYQILSKEPLVAGNILRRREMLYRLLVALRERDVEKIIPKVPQLIQEMEQQAALVSQQQQHPVTQMMENIGATKTNEPPKGDKDMGAKKPLPTNGNGAVGEGF